MVVQFFKGLGGEVSTEDVAQTERLTPKRHDGQIAYREEGEDVWLILA